MSWSFGDWSFAFAAVLYAGVGGSLARRGRDQAQRAVAAACFAMAVWSLTAAIAGTGAPITQFTESVRNLAWLSFLHVLLGRGGTRHRALDALYAVLGFGLAIGAVFNLLMLLDSRSDPLAASVLFAIVILRLTFAVGGLVALHNLYTATAAGARRGIVLPLALLASLWVVDLTFYALALRSGAAATEWAMVRGPVAVLLAPLMALGAARNRAWTIRLSRTVAFRSVGLVAALGYLALVIALASVGDLVRGPSGALIAPLVVIFMALVLAFVAISPRTRAWSRVMIAKHFFAHRYDYRAEWLRFTDTLGVPGTGAAPLEERVVKAVADIVEAPGGALLLPTATGLASGVRWRWPTLTPPPDVGDDRLVALLASGRVVELDAVRADRGTASEAAAIPEWMVADAAAWAVVPLVHFDQLVGAVLLERPLAPRALDWEDFDLLRLAGHQVASYLAEARSQEALGDAARFDEFNRRFAFIMHDIKNLVSQLTLVTRNAERHADNPAFRADMIATLHASTARMNDLLARLSQHNKARTEEPRAIDLGTIAAAVAARHRATHPVVVAGDGGVFALADPARLEQALSHLVQNAIDASPEAEPVTLTLVRQAHEVGIEVADCGAGMTADFVRGSLFRAFASTKSDGFGIGAFEARALIGAMGGRITVVSAPGEGSRFSIWLPSAEPQSVRLVA